ncbi:hypothetical protein BGX29_007429 [Mortierella sp. GBA35]|nr:hypothetical protein BGX29_007429 [Mortierella sp. GBA35]
MEFGLPSELAGHIAIHLDQHDLAQLICVSKEWHLLWTPHLWRTIVMTDKTHEVALKIAEGQGAFHRYGFHIRVFQEPYSSSNAFLLLRSVHDLQLTHLHIGGAALDRTSIDSFVVLLERCPTLRILKIDCFGTGDDEDAERLLAVIPRSLLRLQTLVLFTESQVRVRPRVLQEFLEICPSSLESLSVGVDFCWVAKSGETDDHLEAHGATTIVQRSQPHPNLKCFILETNCEHDRDRSIVPRVLLTFLQGCTSLEVVDDLVLPVMGPAIGYLSWIFGYPAILDVLRGVMGFYPRELVINYSDFLTRDDHLLSQKISTIRSEQEEGVDRGAWHTIFLAVYPRGMSATYRALVETSRLEILTKATIADGTLMASQDLQSILYHGKRLRVLEFYDFPTLMASDIVQSLPWKCTWLASLDIQIAGIARPDVQIDYRCRPIQAGSPLHSGTMAESRAVQRKVYAQLAMLTCLEILNLGMDESEETVETETSENGQVYFDPHLQSTSLEMTLDGGLGMLAGLKALKELNVNNMEHRIGRLELEWIDRHWPRIEVVRGLTKRNVVALSPTTNQREMMSFGRSYGTGPDILRHVFRFTCV